MQKRIQADGAAGPSIAAEAEIVSVSMAGWRTESLNFVSSRRFIAFHFPYFSK